MDTSAHSLEPGEMLLPAIEAGATGRMPSASQTARVAAVAQRVLENGPELLYRQLTEAFVGKHVREAMQWLYDAGLLVHLLPELEATVAFSQEGGRRHKDVWDHTKTVVWQSVPDPAVRWGAVLHDIGKVPTRRFLPNGRVTFHAHAEVGARMFRRTVGKRIAFPQDVADQVHLLILYHLRPGQYQRSWTDSAVRRFARETEPVLGQLLNLGRADVTSRRPGKRKACLRSISELSRRIRELEEEAAKVKPLPSGLGSLLMSELALPPGKHIGVLRKRLEALHEAGTIEGGQDAAYYLDKVREHALLEGIEIRPPRGH